MGEADSSGAYNPDTLEVLQRAFDAAWDLVPNHLKYPDRLRVMIAIQIFEAAARGELDRNRLAREALTRVFARMPDSPAD